MNTVCSLCYVRLIPGILISCCLFNYVRRTINYNSGCLL
nr:MAG TPA: Early E1A protein [Caudoviricetes sp.]